MDSNAPRDPQPDATPQRPPVIETASATTSSETNRSGSLAYVIAGVVLAALVALGNSMSGCTSLVLRAAEQEVLGGLDGGLDELDRYFQNDPNSTVDDGDILDFLQDHGMGGRTDSGSRTQTETSDVKDVLLSDLAVYGDTIDSLLPAMDYAGAQAPVADCARAIVRTDKEATTELVGYLRSAARGDLSAREAAGRARELARKTARELDEIDLGDAEGSKAREVNESLKDARSQAQQRWEAITTEMSLFEDARGTVDDERLASAEKDIATATRDAASGLSAALTASSER